MNKYLLFTFAFLLFFIPGYARDGKDKVSEAKKKEMLEFKINFIADAIDLKDNQRKQFEEVYTQMETERRAAFRKMKDAERKIAGNKNATEADYDKANKEISAAKTQMAEIEKKYEQKFSTFLTKKQMFKMKEAEEQYMQRMRDCRNQKKGEKKHKK